MLKIDQTRSHSPPILIISNYEQIAFFENTNNSTMKHSFIILLVLLTVSCTKQDKDAQETSKIDAVAIRLTTPTQNTLSPDNPNNPYDSAGILHNLVLKSVRNYMHETGDESVNGSMTVIRNYFKTRRNIDNGNPLHLLPTGMMNAITADHRAFLGSSPISHPMRMTYTEFIDSLKRFTDFNLKRFKTLLMSFEDKILQSSMFNDQEKRSLLIGFSVARHSGFYWAEGLDDLAFRGPKKAGFLRKLGAVVSAVIGDGIAAVGLLALGAPFDDLVEISVTGSQAMYFWITGAYSDTH